MCFCHGRVFPDARARSAHELAVPLSKEHRQKIAKAMMGNNRHLGHHHTEETKKRISETMKERASQLSLRVADRSVLGL